MVREKCLMAPSPHIHMLVMQVYRTCWLNPPPPNTHTRLLLTLGSPLLPPSKPGSPLQPLSCDWRRGESRYLVPGRRKRAKGDSLECYKSEQRSRLSQLCETQSKLRIKGGDEERGRLTLQWWIQQRNDTFPFTLWVLLKAEPLDDGLEQRKHLNYPPEW